MYTKKRVSKWSRSHLLLSQNCQESHFGKQKEKSDATHAHLIFLKKHWYNIWGLYFIQIYILGYLFMNGGVPLKYFVFSWQLAILIDPSHLGTKTQTKLKLWTLLKIEVSIWRWSASLWITIHRSKEDNFRQSMWDTSWGTL
jgi:hypothetical protein